MPDPKTVVTKDMLEANWRQIADWLVDTDIDLAELSGPGWQVRLLREAGYEPQSRNVPGRNATWPDKSTSGSPGLVIVRGTVAGVFLDRHPLRTSQLAPAGAQVRQGDILGLLQLGTVLAPVMAPVDGLVAGMLVSSGAMVGFGADLVQINPGEASWKST